MYGMKPIIKQLVSELYTEYENGLMKAVQSCGFDVDKERLAQALGNAQKFYMEGYHDAMTNHDVVKVVRCKECKSGKAWKNQHSGFEGFKCELLCADIDPDDFCSYGERRIDNE